MIALFDHFTVYASFSFDHTDIYKTSFKNMIPVSVDIIFFHCVVRACFQVFQINSFRMGKASLVFCRLEWGFDHIQALFYMKLSKLSVPFTVIIIYTIGNITGLLGL